MSAAKSTLLNALQIEIVPGLRVDRQPAVDAFMDLLQQDQILPDIRRPAGPPPRYG
jgi:hypothetical protein